MWHRSAASSDSHRLPLIIDPVRLQRSRRLALNAFLIVLYLQTWYICIQLL